MQAANFKFNSQCGQSLATHFALKDDVSVDLNNNSIIVNGSSITYQKIKELLGPKQEKHITVFKGPEPSSLGNATPSAGDLFISEPAGNVFIYGDSTWHQVARAEKIQTSQSSQTTGQQTDTEDLQEQHRLSLEGKIQRLEEIVKDVISTLIPSRRNAIAQKYGLDVTGQ